MPKGRGLSGVVHSYGNERPKHFMKKKILFAANIKPHFLFHLPYMRWFQAQGYEVHACARELRPGEAHYAGAVALPYCDRFYNIPIERSPFKAGNLAAYRAIKAILAENDYRLITCHTPMGGLLTRLAARKARRRGAAVLYTAHGFHFYKGAPLVNWLVYYPIEKICANRTDVLITINTEDYAFARAHLRPGCVRYVPGVGVETETIAARKAAPSAIREKNGISADAFLVISVGELNRNKNHMLGIEALAKLRDQGVRPWYLICGEGAARRELTEKIRAYGLESQVRLLGQRQDVVELLHAGDLFLFPSFREGLSKSLMEAMAAGLPVVCSDIRGNRDLIQAGEGGVLVAPADADGCAAAVAALAADPARRREMGLRNLETIRRFSVDSVLQEYAAIYRDVLRL
jgi:glycosyltransferase EpsD